MMATAREREQQVPEHGFRVEEAQQRARSDTASQQEQDGWHTNPPGKPLAEQGKYTDAGQKEDSADGHNGVSSVE